MVVTGGPDRPSGRERRTQQQRRAETERRVLTAATELVAQGGSRAMSLERVGRAAGYSRGIVNHHFGSKQQLLAAVVRHAQRVFDAPVTDGSGLERLVATVRAYLASLYSRAPAGRAFLLLWSEALAGDPVLASLFDERDTWFRGLLREIVAEGVRDGSIRADVDPDAMGVIGLGLLRGTAIQLVLTSTDASRGAGGLDRVAREVVGLLRHGLEPASR